VLINRDSRAWIIVTLLLLAAASVFYAMDSQASAARGGPSGGTWYGIIFGAAGSAMMLFALLLGLKKRLRTLRVGRAYHWMQGHVWLGLLSYPIILYHSGFRWGGPFTQILMWLFTIVVVSGLIGLVIQQYMPAKILREVRFETIYEQIDHVVEQLAAEADDLVRRAVGTSAGQAFEMEVVPAGGQTATLTQTNVAGAKILGEFYTAHVRPYLAPRVPPQARLKTESAARLAFDQVRLLLPPAMQEHLDDLASIVEERRQLADQRSMHHLLHGWLIVHVPLSYALILLAAWHAVYALRFVTPHW
jgi:hypothetical protein